MSNNNISNLLSQDEYSAKAEELVKSIGIPSQPKIILAVNKEINKPDADLKTISEIISKDVSISAKVLKLANSSFFGIRENVDSIDRAIAMLGMKDFRKIIMTSALREMLGENDTYMERFWDHSMTAAAVASRIAEKVGHESPEQAYIAGLFHDCGVPFLMKKYADYTGLVDYALSVVNAEALSGAGKSIVGVEDKRYNTHHCAVGYIIAKSWNLSPSVHQSIWYHHYIHLDIHVNESTRHLSAILILADYISSYMLFRRGGGCSVDPAPEWARMHKDVMYELNLQEYDVIDLMEDLEHQYVVKP